jgi:hypothetical protein
MISMAKKIKTLIDAFPETAPTAGYSIVFDTLERLPEKAIVIDSRTVDTIKFSDATHGFINHNATIWIVNKLSNMCTDTQRESAKEEIESVYQYLVENIRFNNISGIRSNFNAQQGSKLLYLAFNIKKK